MKIGVISDTHSYMDERIKLHLSKMDVIWHAGDIGKIDVTDELEKVAPLKVVYGNIDDHIARAQFPLTTTETYEGVKISMIHIAGAFGKYNTATQVLLKEQKPQILICGHSHITKVAFDKRFNVLYMNPGAAGIHGFHHVRTLLTFEINQGKIENLKVIELGKRA